MFGTSGNYSYFDADYFLNGPSKGTVYINYLTAAAGNPAYREIAEFIATVVRPKRALEIGCATGIIVRHLSDMGFEAHGIDVSEWAVKNRQHRNVKLAPAKSIPYPDEYFDFVFSVHALEHIPTQVAESAFLEMARVGKNAIHFHMLPIIGVGPYRGDPDAVRKGLRADPTHSLLENKDWWLAAFRRVGLFPAALSVQFISDPQIDLSDSQIAISRHPISFEVFERGHDWNLRVIRSLVNRLSAATESFYHPCVSQLNSMDSGAT